MSSRLLISAFLVVSGVLAQGGPPAKVAVARVARRDFRPTLAVLGSVKTPRMARVSTEIDGLVRELPVEEGARVTPETVVARLDTSRLEIQKREAQAELQLARQQLAELEAGSRPEDVAEAEAAVLEARSQLEEARRDLERASKLRRTDAASEQEFTAAKARAAAAEALWQQRQARRDRVVAGPRKEEVARAVARVDVRQAKLDALKDDIANAVITAPFAGVVTRRALEKGGFVTRGETLVEVVQLDPIWIELYVPERVIQGIGPGAAIEVMAPAEGGRRWQARVSAIVPVADVQARTFPVRCRLANPEGRLLPGMTARADLPFGEATRSLAVPRDAVVPGTQGAMVFVVRDGAAVPVPVATGQGAGGIVAVTGALAEGDQVVVRGNERLRPGQPVLIVTGEGDANGTGARDR